MLVGGGKKLILKGYGRTNKSGDGSGSCDFLTTLCKGPQHFTGEKMQCVISHISCLQ